MTTHSVMNCIKSSGYGIITLVIINVRYKLLIKFIYMMTTPHKSHVPAQ